MMPRIRSIKPEFWTSGQILECSTNARLMFIGLWNFCDDRGRHPYRPKQVKAEIFPADSFTESDIRRMLEELSDNDLITVYAVDSQEFLQINGWHHQRIDKPQPAKYPEPVADHSENIPGTVLPDTIGKDTIGKDKPIGASDDTPKGKSQKKQYTPEFEELWKNRPRRQGPNSKWDAFKAYRARLKDGYTHEQMAEGLKKYGAWLKSQGKANTEFVKQTATFLGPAEHFLEDWLAVTEKPKRTNGMTDEEYYMRGAV